MKPFKRAEKGRGLEGFIRGRKAAAALLVLLLAAGPALAKDGAGQIRAVDIPLDYVRSAGVFENVIFDHPNRTLLVEFKKPMRVLSTLEGERAGISFVGNHYTPPPCWDITHELGFEKTRERVCRTLGRSVRDTCMLFTGADMQNLSVRSARFGETTVYALVTAGVRSNAVRMSRDEGRYVEPGTINIILMANRKLTSRAMARAVISATEAKTAAVQDLDVRSSANPARWQATGTGTDEIIVVEGSGSRTDNTGGHSKLGELIARAVYEAVGEAVHRQNGLTARRAVSQRLRERGVDLQKAVREFSPVDEETARRNAVRIEEILLQPRFASFMESAFAISDDYESGLVSSLESFDSWRRKFAEEMAGERLDGWADRIVSEEYPVVIRMALDALLNGLFARDRLSAPRHAPTPVRKTAGQHQ